MAPGQIEKREAFGRELAQVHFGRLYREQGRAILAYALRRVEAPEDALALRGCGPCWSSANRRRAQTRNSTWRKQDEDAWLRVTRGGVPSERSEERRVGKECSLLC